MSPNQPDFVLALGAFALFALIVVALVGFSLWSAHRARERLEHLVTALGLVERAVVVPPPYAKYAALRRGVLSGTEVSVAYVGADRYGPDTTWLGARVGPGPRRAFGPREMLPWITCARRSGHWGPWVSVCPTASTGDPAFDAEFVTVVTEGFSNFSGATYSTGHCPLPDGFKRALLAAHEDVWFGFDGEFIRVIWLDWLEDPAPIMALLRDVGSVGTNASQPIGPSAAALSSTGPRWFGAWMWIAVAIAVVSIAMAGAMAAGR